VPHQLNVADVNLCDVFKIKSKYQTCLEVLYKTGKDGVKRVPDAV